jgi:hypothetical protein
MIYFQNEDDISRESSPCKSPDTSIKEKETELYPEKLATEAFTRWREEMGKDNHWWMEGSLLK